MTSFLPGRRLAIVVAVVAAITALAAATAAALVLTGGHSHPAAVPPPSTTTTTTTVPATTTTTTAPVAASTTTTAAPTTTTTTGTPACPAADLAISLGDTPEGLGHEGSILVFRNTGQATCQIGGYPGVDADLSDGQQVAAQRTLSGYLGGQRSGGAVTAVDLAPGAVASALIESLDGAPAGSSCVQVVGYDVTPPNTTVTSRLGSSGVICDGLQVHPLVPGTTGSSGQ